VMWLPTLPVAEFGSPGRRRKVSILGPARMNGERCGSCRRLVRGGASPPHDWRMEIAQRGRAPSARLRLREPKRRQLAARAFDLEPPPVLRSAKRF